MKPLFFACLIAALFGAVACIDYTEDFTIHTDGSGTIHAVISMRTDLAKDDPDKLKNDLERMFAGGEGVSLVDYTVSSEDNRRVTEFTTAFRHVDDLKSVLGGGETDITKYFGVFEAEEKSDRFLMKRTVDMRIGDESGESRNIGDTAKKMLASGLLAESHLTYRMRFPLRILAANSGQIDTQTNTVEWKFTVAQATKEPLVMTAEIRKPPILKWLKWLIPGAVALAAVLAIGAGLLFRKWRRARAGRR